MSTSTPAKNENPYQIILAGVRLSYPHLFVPNKTKGAENSDSVAKYSASFILDKVKDAKQIETIQKAIDELLKEKNKGGKLAPDKICLRDGIFKPDAEGYGDGIMFITSSNAKRPSVKDHPGVRDANGKLVDINADDPRIFGGCYVNAVIRLWWQDNANGKRVNGSLESVQYVRPGDPFGAPPVDADEAFGSLPYDPESDPALL